MRLSTLPARIAHRCHFSDRLVLALWMAGHAIEVRWWRWRYRKSYLISARDANRLFWTVQAPEKINL